MAWSHKSKSKDVCVFHNCSSKMSIPCHTDWLPYFHQKKDPYKQMWVDDTNEDKAVNCTMLSQIPADNLHKSDTEHPGEERRGRKEFESEGRKQMKGGSPLCRSQGVTTLGMM